jgi:hypothetical protein
MAKPVKINKTMIVAIAILIPGAYYEDSAFLLRQILLLWP